jgi:PAS domain S-box-containing protein
MKTILLVDDSQQNIYLLDVFLKNAGYNVLSAQNGKQALKTAKQNKPDLIIADILMPVMDGFSLCREWKNDAELKSIPFIFYTATYTDTKDEEFALSLGADMFLRKPMKLEILIEKIKTVLKKAQKIPISAKKPTQKDEAEGYKLYSQRLVNKLESKMLQLEKTNSALEKEIVAHKNAKEVLDLRVGELMSVSRLATKMLSTLSVETVISSALDELVGTATADIAMIFSRKKDELILKAIKPQAKIEIADIAVKKVGVCLCGIAAESNRAVYSRNINEDGRCTLEECKKAGVKSFAALPMSWSGKNKGVLTLASFDGYDFEQNATFIETMQHLISASLENSILHRELLFQTKNLGDSKEQLSLALEAANLGMWDFNPTTFGETHFNDKLLTMLGYEAEELPQSADTWINLLHPDDRDAAIKRIYDHIEGRSDYISEFRLKGKDGSYHWINSIGKIVHRDDDDNPTRMIGIHLDITDRKKDEKELIRLKAAIEQSVDGIFITDKNGIVVYVNPAYEIICGYSKAELIGNTPNILKSDYHSKEFYAELWRIIAERQVWSGRFHNRKKDGTIFTEEATISPVLDQNRQIMNYVAVKKDITEKIQMEKHLAQAQKMESIGTLAGGIAHDFNNILAAIIGYTELSIEDVADGSMIGNNLQEILAAGMRARELVKQILTFARQSDEKIVPIQIDTIIAETLRFIRSSIPSTIEIKSHIESNSQLLGNPTQVHQIVMNLCTNAAQAMEGSGGVMRIGLKNVKIDSHSTWVKLGLSPGDYLELQVSDTGVGIPSDQIESVFDPYFTTKAPGEGTGMGLSLIHGIVEGYGGKITVESEIGKGSVFSVYLPKTKRRDAPDQNKSDLLPSGTEHILFVDDEVSITKLGHQMLERLGYTITTRTSSIEALELFESEADAFDLVITDMTMPKMTGYVLASKLMAIRPDIPIILCTGYSKKISDKMAKEIGIKAFAYKPIVQVELAKTIREVLDDAEKPN